MNIGAQRGPKSIPAIQAEVKQIRTLLPKEYVKERLEMVKRLESVTQKEDGVVKVKYTMTTEELDEMIVANLKTEHQIIAINFICGINSDKTPYLNRVEIDCEP